MYPSSALSVDMLGRTAGWREGTQVEDGRGRRGDKTGRETEEAGRPAES